MSLSVNTDAVSGSTVSANTSQVVGTIIGNPSVQAVNGVAQQTIAANGSSSNPGTPKTPQSWSAQIAGFPKGVAKKKDKFAPSLKQVFEDPTAPADVDEATLQAYCGFAPAKAPEKAPAKQTQPNSPVSTNQSAVSPSGVKVDTNWDFGTQSSKS